jgi:hypothetical protein
MRLSHTFKALEDGRYSRAVKLVEGSFHLRQFYVAIARDVEQFEGYL